jgi:ElaB/YqjD/DUF883 family membrane-anchored ribosome-binding protein
MSEAKTEETKPEGLSDIVRLVRDELAALLASAKESATAEAESAKAAAESLANEISRRLHDAVTDAGQRGHKAADELGELIVTRPIVSLLAAAGLGYLIGKMHR